MDFTKPLCLMILLVVIASIALLVLAMVRKTNDPYLSEFPTFCLMLATLFVAVFDIVLLTAFVRILFGIDK